MLKGNQEASTWPIENISPDMIYYRVLKYYLSSLNMQIVSLPIELLLLMSNMLSLAKNGSDKC